MLQGAEQQYPQVEKLALALVHAAWWLRYYFQAYPIHFFTNQPLKQILLKLKASSMLVKWEVEFGEHDITFVARREIKGQVLADFLVEAIMLAPANT